MVVKYTNQDLAQEVLDTWEQMTPKHRMQVFIILLRGYFREKLFKYRSDKNILRAKAAQFNDFMYIVEYGKDRKYHKGARRRKAIRTLRIFVHEHGVQIKPLNQGKYVGISGDLAVTFIKFWDAVDKVT
jgi:hypothetical protein